MRLLASFYPQYKGLDTLKKVGNTYGDCNDLVVRRLEVMVVAEDLGERRPDECKLFVAHTATLLALNGLHSVQQRNESDTEVEPAVADESDDLRATSAIAGSKQARNRSKRKWMR